MIEFHNTPMGKTFFCQTMPEISDSLKKIAAELAKSNSVTASIFHEAVDIVCMECAYGEETCDSCPVRKTIEVRRKGKST